MDNAKIRAKRTAYLVGVLLKTNLKTDSVFEAVAEYMCMSAVHVEKLYYDNQPQDTLTIKDYRFAASDKAAIKQITKRAMII